MRRLGHLMKLQHPRFLQKTQILRRVHRFIDTIQLQHAGLDHPRLPRILIGSRLLPRNLFHHGNRLADLLALRLCRFRRE